MIMHLQSAMLREENHRVNMMNLAKHKTLTDRIDNTDTVTVVKEVLQGRGSKVMRKINVQALKNKSSDLKLCLSQQTNAFGFLLITNLQRLHRGHSLKPNKVLAYKEFDPTRRSRTQAYTTFRKPKSNFHPVLTLSYLRNYVKVTGTISFPIL